MLYKFIHRAYKLFVASANYLRSPLLLGIRVYFFLQLFQTGMGKLGNIAKVTQFFSSLGIPFPGLNAWFVGSLECFGGALLIVGLFSRPVALMVFISMTIAYVTADMEAFSSFVSDPDKFVKADPFVFWFAALVVLAFGPGLISLDALGKSVFRKRELTSTASSRNPR